MFEKTTTSQSKDFSIGHDFLCLFLLLNNTHLLTILTEALPALTVQLLFLPLEMCYWLKI